MKTRYSRAGRPQQLHDRTSMMVTFERDRLREFEEQCQKHGVSVSEGIRQLIEEDLEKKELGDRRSNYDPLNLNSISQPSPAKRKKTSIKNREYDALETLDYWVDTGMSTRRHWDNAFSTIDDRIKMQRVHNMCLCMNMSSEDRLTFLKTGRIPVRFGQTFTVPTMTGDTKL